MTDAPRTLLHDWLRAALAPDDLGWLEARRAAVAAGDLPAFHAAFGAAPRRLGDAALPLGAAERRAADDARAGWDPRGLSRAEAARLLLLLDVAAATNEFAALFGELCATADVAEAVTLYRGLPLCPDSARLAWQVGEGLRTSIRPILDAIVLRSPFPREQFDQDRWNHMVLKALFVGAPLHPIQGLDARRNPDLARMLGDYADERRAAGRPISPELWRCVGPFATGALLDKVARAAASADPAERLAAALALADSPDPAAAALLARLPGEARAIAGGLDWTTFSERLP